MALPIPEQLNQLNAARQLVLGDSTFYPQIVQGILPIVGATARLELRRWGADFLAETFASPVLALQQKEPLSLVVLQTLKELLEMPGDDPGVVKSVVQAAASIYGLVFRYMYVEPLLLPAHPRRRLHYGETRCRRRRCISSHELREYGNQYLILLLCQHQQPQ